MHKFMDYFDISEKSIELGDNIIDLLKSKKDSFSKNLLAFLNSDDISDKFKYSKVEWFDEDGKLLSIIDDSGKVTKVRLMKLLGLLGYDSKNFDEYEVNALILSMKKGDDSRLKVLKGEDIYWAYNCKNYAPAVTGGGDLHSSCMRHSDKNDFMEIYASNPNQVSLLVVMTDGKVGGRALLWNDGENTFIDRIYLNDKADMSLYEEYMRKNDIGDEPFDITLDRKGKYDHYPYMDTLEYYDVESGVLSADGDSADWLYLKNIDGTATGKDSGMVYSVYLHKNIPERDSVWSEYMNSYIYSEEASNDTVRSKICNNDYIMFDDVNYKKCDFAIVDGKIILDDFCRAGEINEMKQVTIYDNKEIKKYYGTNYMSYEKLIADFKFGEFFDTLETVLEVDGIPLDRYVLIFNGDGKFEKVRESDKHFKSEKSENFDYKDYYPVDVNNIIDSDYEDEIYDHINSLWVHNKYVDENGKFLETSPLQYSKQQRSYILGNDIVNINGDVVTKDYYESYGYQKIGKFYYPTSDGNVERIEKIVNALESGGIDFNIKTEGKKYTIITDYFIISNFEPWKGIIDGNYLYYSNNSVSKVIGVNIIILNYLGKKENFVSTFSEFLTMS